MGMERNIEHNLGVIDFSNFDKMKGTGSKAMFDNAYKTLSNFSKKDKNA